MTARLKPRMLILAALLSGFWAGVTLSSDPEWRYLSHCAREDTAHVHLFDEADALFGGR